MRGALQKPADPDVVVALFTAIDRRFAVPKPRYGVREFADIEQQVTVWLETGGDDAELNVVIEATPAEYQSLLEAMLVLSQLGENSLNPILGRSDAFGSVLRKQLGPLLEGVEGRIEALLG